MIRYEALNVSAEELRNFLQNVLLTKCESDEKEKNSQVEKMGIKHREAKGILRWQQYEDSPIHNETEEWEDCEKQITADIA